MSVRTLALGVLLAASAAAAQTFPDRPAKLTYTSGGNATPSHLAMEMLKRTAGIEVRHIPYKGTPPAIVQKLAAEIERALRDPGGVRRTSEAGLTPAYLAPERTAARMAAEQKAFAQVVEDANIHAE